MIKEHAAFPSKPHVPARTIKWDHYRELKNDSTIKRHLPATMKLNKQSLFSMLSEYTSVYLKPNRGAFGVGVIKVQKMVHKKQPRFLVHEGSRQKTFYSRNQVYAFVLANMVNKDYLVQQGIDLLRWNERPFDLRLMIKKQSDNTWLNEGFVGRVAHPKKIVTNIRSGGTAVSIDDLLAPYTNVTSKIETKKKLNLLGEQICELLEKKYPGIQLFGVDLGLDQNLKPWIIEVNNRPEKICWKCMLDLYKKSSESSHFIFH
ncbi:YheC/YheD family protein [Paenibacillus profundus]|uniref:YheC/YheD family protein n=1 Tax=Paenibacillus profundus TaxID=1173085 RepID=A0ABS8YI06_9BACL|nr:YheC/YheD family protein [Paenibacillus profundus]MCE5171446.1 YheC/YheD family protein [Paenibacillus profundus]